MASKTQFDRVVYDFGKVSQVATVTGAFKFKNVGDGVLKIEPPKPSCGCTFAELKPDTLKPGVGLVNLAIDVTLFSLAARLARRSTDGPRNHIFREAGAQNSAPPLEASPEARAATERVSCAFVCGATLR